MVISNRFPPDAEGGYEWSCYDVVQELRHRGFEVLVLTRASEVYDRDPSVRRILSYRRSGDRSLLFRGPRLDAADLTNVERAYREFQPDLLYLWNPVGLSLAAIASLTRRLPWMTYVAEHWFREWLTGGRIPDAYAHQLLTLSRGPVTGVGPIDGVIRSVGQRLARDRFTSFIACMPTVVQFDSEFLRSQAEEARVLPWKSHVIHHGIRFESFSFEEPRNVFDAPRLLFVGRVVPAKGLETAIRALRRVVERCPDATLTIAGPISRRYLRSLRRLAQRERVLPRVRFQGVVPRDALPRLYRSHDVLVFPSTWEEPFGITLVEAMASGLPILSTGRGGSAEAAPAGEVSVEFRAGDESDLAKKALGLLADEDLRGRLARRAREYAKQRFGLDGMVSRVLGDVDTIRGLTKPVADPSGDPSCV
jgi:glycosyltransferase involved in cell wall biosynthesis